MSCCPPYTQLFSNAAVLSVSLTDSMKAKYGVAPRVEVFMYDIVSGFYKIFRFVEIQILSSSIHFDFGGLGTGYIKIS